MRTPLVGRRRELDTLLDTFERAKSTRQVQLVTLVGEPGIGKSRLVYELFQTVEHDPELIYWRQGRSLPYGEGISFWALGEMVKAHAGILETDAKDEAEQKLRSAVEAALPDEDVGWTLSHLRPLAGIEDIAGRNERQEEAFAAWRGFLEGIADQSPLVLVFEDLHWADEGLLDFVDHLIDWATRVPLLVVGTARSELLTRRPAWGGGKTNALTLSLAPLSGVETAELVHGLLEQAAIPADIQATLLERAGGNPLYAEEFVRLLDERANGAALPETVQGIIAARLDVLTREEKELLQDAAVLGRTFWVGGLGQEREAAEQALHRLERREFVQRERRSTVAGETEYAFRHALVREVAYEQIPRAKRGEKHRRVADWLEKLGRPDDLAELLAHHYIAVLDYSEPDGELAERAAGALGEAGDRALALNAYGAAAGFYRRALDIGGREAPGLFLFGLGSALTALADAAAVDRLVEASATLLAAGDPETAAEAETMLAEIAFTTGDAPGVDAHARRAVELVHGRPPSAAVARALGQAARFAMLDGRWRDAIDTGREAEGMAADLGLVAIRADALATLGTARADFGDDGGDADLELAIELAEAANAPLPLSRALNNLAWRYSGVDLRRTHALQQRNYETMQRYGHVGQTWWARGQLAGSAYDLGRWDEALEHIEAVLAYVAAGTPHYFESGSRLSRAAISFARGDDRTFAVDIDRSLELAAKATDPQATAPVVAAVACLRVLCGDLPGARASLDSALETARGTEIGFEMIAYEAALVTALLDLDPEQLGLPSVGVLDTPQRRATAALLDRDLLGCADALAELGQVSQEAYLRLRAGERLLGDGRLEEAVDQLERALAFYRGVGATRFIAEAESLLAGTEQQTA